MRDRVRDRVRYRLRSVEYQNLEQYINVQLIQVNTTNIETRASYNILLDDYIANKSRSDHVYAEYSARKKEWNDRVDKYSRKLVELATDPDTRKEIIDYRKKIDSDNPLIGVMENPEFVLESKEKGEIAILKKRSDSIFYWITEWKDWINDEIHKERPPTYSPRNINGSPINILTNVPCMIPYWIKHNSGMNLYVIKITFKRLELDIEYQDTNKEWYSCYRTIFNGEPSCISP